MAGASLELEVERSAPDGLYGGRYRLLERVGVGGMATVYRAWDERLMRDVAVKVIAEWLADDPASVCRLRREAELSAGLAHPNIVATLDAGSEPQEHIVMELVNGVHAGTMLPRRARLTPGQVLHVVTQVCDALAYAHDRDVVHHDVSPRNILIKQPEGTAKLADFGLASGAVEIPATRSAAVMGTPGYVAPEVLWGAGASPRSDLYSLAVVAYRLLAGRLQLRSADPHATAPQATSAPRMPPLAEVRPDLPHGVIEPIQRALAQDPGARQESVTEFRAQLVAGHSAPLRLAA